jgi:hypothetical protein
VNHLVHEGTKIPKEAVSRVCGSRHREESQGETSPRYSDSSILS